MNEPITFERTYAKRGDSMSIVIPKELGEYLQLTEGDTIQLAAYTKKKGRFIAIWKK